MMNLPKISIPYVTTLIQSINEINRGEYTVTFRVQTEQNIVINMKIHNCKFLYLKNGMMEVVNYKTRNQKFKLLLSSKMAKNYLLYEKTDTDYVFVYFDEKS